MPATRSPRPSAIKVGDVNEAPIDIDLSGNTLVENVAGAVIGTLTAIDPDAGDSHSFEVSDPRFEVVDGQLKLKDGVFDRLRDRAGLERGRDRDRQRRQQGAGNLHPLRRQRERSADRPHARQQSELSENAAGAVVGTLSVADPDAGDSQSFEVSDDRFEVVERPAQTEGRQVARPRERAYGRRPGHRDRRRRPQIQQTFTINVGDVNEGQTGLALAGNAGGRERRRRRDRRADRDRSGRGRQPELRRSPIRASRW